MVAILRHCAGGIALCGLLLASTSSPAQITQGLVLSFDAGGSGQWDISGFALHQEFDLLAQAGLSPLEILQMTTLNGAKFLGREATMGSVEVGKDANLVVLDGNPVVRVQNLHRIHAVIRGGAFYSKEALNSLETRIGTAQ